MKKSKTERGFNILKFKDRYAVECSLQKSSIATEDCIWLGVNEARIVFLDYKKESVPVEVPPNALCGTRMHLSREQVKNLLPYLQKFVETGDF